MPPPIPYVKSPTHKEFRGFPWTGMLASLITALSLADVQKGVSHLSIWSKPKRTCESHAAEYARRATKASWIEKIRHSFCSLVHHTPVNRNIKSRDLFSLHYRFTNGKSSFWSNKSWTGLHCSLQVNLIIEFFSTTGFNATTPEEMDWGHAALQNEDR